MAVESILSFYSGNGHDGNLSIRVNSTVFTLEFERVFGNRYFTRLLNPFSGYSYWEIDAFSEKERVKFLNYKNNIL